MPADPGRCSSRWSCSPSSGPTGLRQQRLSSLATYAALREWRFTPDGTGLESRFPGDPFGRGHGRRATNVIEGRYEGRAFLAFDYTYVTSSGDDSTTHRCSVHHHAPRLAAHPDARR